jgi:hypothetical protein
LFRKENGEVDIISLVLTVAIAAVTMMVGILVVSNVDIMSPVETLFTNTTGTGSGAPPAGVLSNVTITGHMVRSVLSTTYTGILTNSGTAFTFLALGLFVLAAVFIVGIVAGVLGGKE